ncbi:NAD-dependent epimerase/dehydratase family protein [Ferrovibrio sp.]|uniref:NAD-dependent epimerase/dehydratase family protein n=1 Tax=Ferrovibrio sp. TaxID=1917215 RepID=UPI000CA8489D|nr:NAD-dependent epimerase/dehydratase family protein [Ferrovibrio sp.]PJI37947.1 MAG: epimerase [Ferrovibrio sp.]
MNILIFGATGMVGQAVLRECLLDPGVSRVVAIGRSAARATPMGRLPEAGKLEDLHHIDMYDYSAIEDRLTGFDACFFCLGVSSAGMSEAAYTRVTYDLTLAAATTLARLNPQMVFTYVSGRSTDGTENGPSMWARVKGRTENALLKLPFKAAYMFRPGVIEPMDGIKPKSRVYRAAYYLLMPCLSLVRFLWPQAALTTTRQVGRAMIAVARTRAAKQILEVADINAL